MQAAGIQPHVAVVFGHSQAGLFGVTAIHLRDQQEAAKEKRLLAMVAGGAPSCLAKVAERQK